MSFGKILYILFQILLLIGIGFSAYMMGYSQSNLDYLKTIDDSVHSCVKFCAYNFEFFDQKSNEQLICEMGCFQTGTELVLNINNE